MSDSKKTNLNDFMGELGAGVFCEKLIHSLQAAALATLHASNGSKKGKVTIDFTFQQVGDNDQVIISHKLASSIPTLRGKKTEEDLTETPMFVGKGGALTINQPQEDISGRFSLDIDQDGVDVKRQRQEESVTKMRSVN